MPSDARISSTWHYYESTLVAESAEPEDAPLKYMEYNLKEIKELVSGPSLVYWAKYLREGIVVTPYNERCGRKVGRVILKFVSPEYLGL
ncbi:MAG: hypothetical protein QF879_13265 [Candidatus Latescibacteria bacterium]|nr:hypothetical protein [Candidatus Latescibacterota bacterium]MDP7236890.1 hypothetical protein [Candidatus Latescibacterota bacterium]